MFPIKLTPRREATIARVWSILCLLVALTALAAVTEVLWSLSPLWLGIALIPAALVTLVFATACCADWSSSRRSSMRR